MRSRVAFAAVCCALLCGCAKRVSSMQWPEHHPADPREPEPPPPAVLMLSIEGGDGDRADHRAEALHKRQRGDGEEHGGPDHTQASQPAESSPTQHQHHGEHP